MVLKDAMLRNVICTLTNVVKYVREWLTCISITGIEYMKKINVSRKSICMRNICQLAARIIRGGKNGASA